MGAWLLKYNGSSNMMKQNFKYILGACFVFAIGVWTAFQWPRMQSVDRQKKFAEKMEKMKVSDLERASSANFLRFAVYEKSVRKSIDELPEDLKNFAKNFDFDEFDLVRKKSGEENAELEKIQRGALAKADEAFLFEKVQERDCSPGMFSSLHTGDKKFDEQFMLSDRFNGTFAGRSNFYSEKYAARFEYQSVKNDGMNNCQISVLVVPDDGSIAKELKPQKPRRAKRHR
jgi:hypothetical protein